jgi:hypothetical protein
MANKGINGMELPEGNEVVSSCGGLEPSNYPCVCGQCASGIEYSGVELLCPGCWTAVTAFSERNPADAEAIETYLGFVRLLAREVEIAIGAIRSGSYIALMESVSRQEVLCCDLMSRAGLAQEAIWAHGGISEARYERELRVLRFHVRTYDALLRRCSKNTASLMSVYRSFFGSFGNCKTQAPVTSTLVCKV